MQVTSRLRANIFEREGSFAMFSPTMPYVSMGVGTHDGSKPRSRDSEGHGPGFSSYPGGYGSVELLADDSYGKGLLVSSYLRGCCSVVILNSNKN